MFSIINMRNLAKMLNKKHAMELRHRLDAE